MSVRIALALIGLLATAVEAAAYCSQNQKTKKVRMWDPRRQCWVWGEVKE